MKNCRHPGQVRRSFSAEREPGSSKKVSKTLSIVAYGGFLLDPG